MALRTTRAIGAPRIPDAFHECAQTSFGDSREIGNVYRAILKHATVRKTAASANVKS